MGNKSILDRLISVTLDKTKRNVALIFIFGFIIRIFAARNLSVAADDAGHALASIGIFESMKISNWAQSTILWYYLQGVFYKIFGLTMIGSRFATVLFGSFSIILVFIFVKRFFKSTQAALISSLLVAVSPILIKNTLSEMDIAVCFFTLLSAYFLFSFFETRSKKDLFLCSLIIGIGVMIKL